MGDVAELMEKLRADDGLRREVLRDPRSVLAAHGLVVPAGVDLRVVESTDTVVYFALPPAAPSVAGELEEEQLEAVAGGTVYKCCCCCSCDI